MSVKLNKNQYNKGMNITELKNRLILLFGKSRAFNSDEFESQMKFHKIDIANEYSDNIAVIVEGKMMTPYEQNKSDELYELTRGMNGKKIEFISIDLLEKELAKHINADTLLMSLKLSHDKERLKGFIINSELSNDLFFRLLKLYSWGGEDFFENDDNRDVTAALIGRFYENIERNHNVQYATLGLMHLLKQTKDEKLIEAIATLEPLQNSFKNENSDANHAIATTIVKHPYTPKSVLKMLVKKSSTHIKTLIAMRDDCDVSIQNKLYANEEKVIYEALSHNENLDLEILKKLIKTDEYAKNMAIYINLSDEIFELFIDDYSEQLAQNSSVNNEMQNRLIALEDENTKVYLASNGSISQETITKLLKDNNHALHYAIFANLNTPKDILEDAYKDEVNHIALSQNENTPKPVLEQLGNSSNALILKNIAKNTSTPVDVLYQLQLDSRFERSVKENPAFAEHIQSENIGWLI